MIELLKCPFCGSKPQELHNPFLRAPGPHAAQCSNADCVICDMFIPVENWNIRANQSPLQNDALLISRSQYCNELEHYEKRIDTLEGMIVRLRDEVSSLESNKTNSPWIPVSERLPEVDADVLWLHNGKYREVIFGSINAHKDTVFPCSSRDNYSIAIFSHWMPIPSLPEVKE